MSALLDKPSTHLHPPVEAAQQALLRAEALTVSYAGQQVVHGVDFAIGAGESLALIGESGSGKSTIARAVLRLLPETGRAGGRVQFAGQEVLGLPERHFRGLRGRSIGFVPQDPGASLNPVRKIGVQAREAAALLDLDTRAERSEAVLEAFAQVGLDDPRRVADAYPHELSGGMLQRVLIGLAVLPRPALLVADEPTSALDVTIQKRILDLLDELRADLDISLLLITHDLAIAAERADSLVVLKDGLVQEAGPTRAVFDAPTSPYSQRLHADVPALNPDRYAHLRDVGAQRGSLDAESRQIEVAGVSRSFGALRAVDDVSFSVAAGTTHALVGESGSGKTTAIRLLVGLEEPDAGQIRVAGEQVHGRSRAELRETRRHLQLVYQNPFTSLDPTWKVERIVREPLDRYAVGSRPERRERVAQALESVGLSPELLHRKPAALSGGQRQRVAIARALVLRPDVIVLDEPTSALDVSVQADIVELLLRLQVDLGLTYVFVSHDLALVRQFAHTVSVMQRGRVVEHGRVVDVFDAPQQDYTRTLLASIPRRRAMSALAQAEVAPGFRVKTRLGFNTRVSFSAEQGPAAGLRDGIDLFVAAERLGYQVGWAYQRHFDHYLSSPLPFFAAAGQHTERIGLGSAVIPMRYQDPVLLAEAAGTTDLLIGGRLELALSAGENHHWDAVFGGVATDARTEARHRLGRFLQGVDGEVLHTVDTEGEGAPIGTPIRVTPHSPGLRGRVRQGVSSIGSAEHAARLGVGLITGTVLHGLAESESFGAYQARVIEAYRTTWLSVHATPPPPVAVAASLLPGTDEATREAYAAYDRQRRTDGMAASRPQGSLPPVIGADLPAGMRISPVHHGDPDAVVDAVLSDPGIAAADEVVLFLPPAFGLSANVRLLGDLARTVAPALGWSPAR